MKDDPPPGKEITWCCRHPKLAGEWIVRHRDACKRLDLVHTDVLEKYVKTRERADRAEEALRWEQERRLKAEQRLKESVPRI